MAYLRDVVSIYADTLDTYYSSYSMDITRTGMKSFQRRIRNAYIYEREVLDEVILRVMYASSNQ